MTPISLQDYLTAFEGAIDDFKGQFKDICDDKAINFIVQQFCDSQKNVSATIRESVEAAQKAQEDSNK